MPDIINVPIRPRRSVLYLPGDNPRVLDKGRTLPADCLILNLEDGVAPDKREEARALVAENVKKGGYGRREVIIRVNPLATPDGQADIEMAATSGAGAVCLPKVESPRDITDARAALSKYGAPSGVAIWAMMETALAITYAREIAAVGPDQGHPLTVFVVGTNDIAKDTRATLAGLRFAMVPALSMCIIAARAYGIEIVDGVYNDFRDDRGFRRECEQSRALGFDGKTLIHPTQIVPCNEAFAPPRKDIAWAEAVLAAFADPANKGKGVVTVDGNMVELLHADIARRIMALAHGLESTRSTEQPHAQG